MTSDRVGDARNEKPMATGGAVCNRTKTSERVKHEDLKVSTTLVVLFLLF